MKHRNRGRNIGKQGKTGGEMRKQKKTWENTGKHVKP